MYKNIALSAGLALSMLTAGTAANALTVDPGVGLTDFVFDFDGVGSSATFAGDDTVDITLTSSSLVTVHVEDCCVLGDEWDLLVDGSIVAWDVIVAGDGSANGSTDLGAAGTYFEATYTFGGGAGDMFSLDLLQTAGISGGAWMNLSVAQVPVPAAGGLLLAGLFGAGVVGRKRKKA